MAGESFTLHLNDYFVEQQQGRTLDITLSYGYRDVLALEEMPDYRLVQMLVEEVFYIYDAAWCDIFWEVQNRSSSGPDGRGRRRRSRRDQWWRLLHGRDQGRTRGGGAAGAQEEACEAQAQGVRPPKNHTGHHALAQKRG